MKRLLFGLLIFFVFVVLVLVLWALYLRFSMGAGWADWTGLGDYTSPTGQFQRGKTVWDLLQLLIIPFALGSLTLWFSHSQRERDQYIADQREKTQRDLAQENLREATLQTYFDKMTELLLEKELRSSQISDEVRSIARTRTLSILRNLDGGRRTQLLLFLYQAGLISGDVPIIDLSFADLREVDLSYAHLKGMNLSKANLRKAILQFAELDEASFYYADLNEANLSWAHLRGANLQCGLPNADLGVANLDGASLFGADLGGANLLNASLVGADLRHANFKYINRFLGDIGANNIHRTVLAGADLSNCNLKDAAVDVDQLMGAKLSQDTIMPDGTKFEEWTKNRAKTQKTPE